MATGDTVSPKGTLQLVVGTELASEATDNHHLNFHHTLLLTTLVVWSMLEELKSEGPNDTHMTTPSQGLCLSLSVAS